MMMQQNAKKRNMATWKLAGSYSAGKQAVFDNTTTKKYPKYLDYLIGIRFALFYGK